MSVTIYSRCTNLDTSLNLSNANFRRLMDLIGIELGESLCGEFAGLGLQDLRDRTLFALDSLRAMPSLDAGTPTVEAVGTHGARWIDVGVREGYYESRLTALLAQLDIALETNELLLFS